MNRREVPAGTTARVAALCGAAFAALLSPDPALAHTGPFGVTGYPVLVLHPFIVLDHALCLAVAGLFAGQQESLGPWRGLVSLLLGVVAGFASLVLFPGFPGDVFLPMIFAALIGVLVALAPRLGRAAAALVVLAAGFAVGLNTYPEDGLVFVLAMTLGGLMIGAGVLFTALAWPVSLLKRDWHKIGVRIAGSWIAASVCLILALVLKA